MNRDLETSEMERGSKIIRGNEWLEEINRIIGIYRQVRWKEGLKLWGERKWLCLG